MSKSQKNPFALPDADLAHIMRLAGNDLRTLRGKKLFLTGGTGFFGKWITGALLHANDEIGLNLQLTLLSRDPAAFQQRFPGIVSLPTLSFLSGHIADLPPVADHYDFILHAAADTTAFTDTASENDRTRAITDGTQRILDLTQSSGAQRLLNISSGAVYGAAAGKPGGAGEDDYESAVPLNDYARAKRAAESLCAASGLDFVTARAFAFLGPHLPLNAHFAAGNFLRDALSGGPIVVRGDGTALRSYLHPADLVVWLLRLLVRGARGEAYNVGSDEAVTTAQLARLISDLVPSHPEVTIQSLQPNGPQNIYLPDISRARTELALDVAIPLRDAITRTLEFLRNA